MALVHTVWQSFVKFAALAAQRLPPDGAIRSLWLEMLCARPDGERSLALQVKTTEHALRRRGRGDERKPHHLEFPLGAKAAKLNRPGVMFAFVDLAVWSNKQVVVYLVPSPKVHDFCAAWVDHVPMVRFHPSIEWMAPYREAWNRIASIVGEPPESEKAAEVADAPD